MRFEVTALRHGKEDCRDLDRCEDSLAYDENKGLLAVSDGVGSMMFSNLWSRCLVEQFIAEPLLDNDGFEVEYWMRQARARFEAIRPDPDTLPYYAAESSLQGSAATLVGARFHAAELDQRSAGPGYKTSSQVAVCSILAIGDSCAIHYSGDRYVNSYPLQHAAEFAALPVCLPTQGYRNSWWKSVVKRDIQIRNGDVLVLATDKVSEWLLTDHGDEVRTDRFRVLSHQTSETWPFHLMTLRRAKLIVDDDSTAVIIRIRDVSGPLSERVRQAEEIRKSRRERLEKAIKAKDYINIALECGSCFLEEKVTQRDGREMPLCQTLRLRTAHKATEGRRELLEALERAFTSGSKDNQELQELWNKYREVLATVAFAETIRSALRQRGVVLDPPVEVSAHARPIATPQEPSEDNCVPESNVSGSPPQPVAEDQGLAAVERELGHTEDAGADTGASPAPSDNGQNDEKAGDVHEAGSA